MVFSYIRMTEGLEKKGHGCVLKDHKSENKRWDLSGGFKESLTGHNLFSGGKGEACHNHPNIVTKMVDFACHGLILCMLQVFSAILLQWAGDLISGS